MKSPARMIVAMTMLGLSVDSFLVPNPTSSAVSKTELFVLADPPRKGSEEMSVESESSDLQPIRRLRRDKKEPLIAVVGRPNVGKSALVNRIAETQSGGAIVADESGITRDRTYRQAEFLGEVGTLLLFRVKN